MSDPTQTPMPETDAPVRACASCSAPLADGQDWCLECGSAQPGRLGGRPGWRAALTVVGVTAVLVGGAGAAAYAALTTEAQRDATAAAPPQATPTVATTPAVPAPAQTQAPATTPTVKAPDSESPDVPAPSDGGDEEPTRPPSSPSTPAPSTPSTPSTPSGGSGGGDSGAGAGTTGTTPAAGTPVAAQAKVYDPFGRAAKKPSNPANATDGKAKTAFELPVDQDGKVNAGLTLSLEKAATLSDLELKADTPGFTVEIYATKDATVPPDVLDARWEHIGDRRDAGVRETVSLDGKYRHVLLWVTVQPADTKVAIPEVQLLD